MTLPSSVDDEHVREMKESKKEYDKTDFVADSLSLAACLTVSRVQGSAKCSPDSPNKLTTNMVNCIREIVA